MKVYKCIIGNKVLRIYSAVIVQVSTWKKNNKVFNLSYAVKNLDGINQWSMIRGGKPSKRKEFIYSIGQNSASIR